MYKIDWTRVSEYTYHKETEYILSKWSFEEVDKFIVLVEDKIQVLATGTMTGKPSNIENVWILKISKQTFLAYKVFEQQSRIELLSF